MFPAINRRGSSLSGASVGSPKRGERHEWTSMHRDVSTHVGSSPYGPGRIESTDHEKVVVNSFRSYMEAISTMQKMHQFSQSHARHLQKTEYYERLRGDHKQRNQLDLKKLSSGNKRRSRRGRQRHSIGSKKKGAIRRVKTPRGLFVENCRKLGVAPDARIIVGTDQQTYFNFAQAGCSSNQVIALMQSLAECNSTVVEQLNLSTNGYSNADLTKVLAVLRVDEIIALDLSRNTFGNSAVVELRDLILNEDSNLQDINLFSCHLRRGHFKTLNTAFMRTKTLRRLNLGRNGIDDIIADGIVAAVRGSSIEELDLSWNNINAAASRFLECPKLRWLNLEMNNIKKGTEKAWAKGLAENSTLIWLDLSGAAFEASECRVIGKALKKNHTLLELRMDQMHGCEVHTDALGFLVVLDHVVDEKPHSEAKVYEWLDLPPILCRQTDKADIDAALMAEDTSSSQGLFDPMIGITETKASAWITGGWTHFSFTVEARKLFTVVGEGGNPQHCPFDVPTDRKIQKMYIHLHSDDFVKTAMVPAEDGAFISWKVDRILPPSRQFFFFSCEFDDGIEHTLLSEQWLNQDITCRPSESAKGELRYHIVSADPSSDASSSDAEKESESKKDMRHTKGTKPKGKGKAKAKKKSSALATIPVNYYDILVRLPQQPLSLGQCVPRPTPNATEGEWDLMNSVFVPRLKEADSRSFYNTNELMRQAFKHDWKMSNISAFVTDQNELSGVWEVLKQHYARLMDIFTYCAGIGMSFSVGEQAMHKWSWMTFSKWVSSIELQGSEENCLTSHDTDIIFITCNVKLSNDDVKPDRFLSRFEFLQAVVRLAMKRYAWTESGTSLKDSVLRVLNEYILPKSGHIDNNDDWRRTRLYTKGVSDYYSSVLRRLRKKYLELSAGGGWADEIGGKMSYAEYRDFILNHKLLDGVKRVSADDLQLDERLDGTFNEMHCKLAFIKSMMVVKNDAATFKHKRMTFVDFLEALGRLCDYFDSSNVPLHEKLPKFVHDHVFITPKNKDAAMAVKSTEQKQASM